MIQVHGLYKKFGEKAALNGIDLKVTSGERVAFVGHNGSGKTTLLRCILALHAFEGQIAVAGLDIRVARRRVLTQIGFVPQNRSPSFCPCGDKADIPPCCAHVTIMEVANETCLNAADG